MSAATQQSQVSTQDMLAAALLRIQELEAANKRSVSFKVSEKGAISMMGMGKFPVTLYKGQWERIIEALPQLKEFIKANESKLSVKK